MAEPKKRLTSARSGARRSHIKAKKISLANCPKCQAKIRPHHVCLNCGYYKGQDILKLEEKAKAKEARRKARDEAESEQEKVKEPKPKKASEGKVE